MYSFQIPVLESKGSDKVVKFVNASEFKAHFIKAHDSGNIYAVYMDEYGDTVGVDIWDELHEEILLTEAEKTAIATYEAIEETVQATNLGSKMLADLGDFDYYEDVEDETLSDTEYALMFDLDKNELMFLNYAWKENGWAKTAEQQNPWVFLGYYSPNDVEHKDVDPLILAAAAAKYLPQEDAIQ